MPRKPPPNRKAPADKLSVRFNIKLTTAGREAMAAQAKAAGFASAAAYLRDLAARDRGRLNLPPHDFNAGVAE